MSHKETAEDDAKSSRVERDRSAGATTADLAGGASTLGVLAERAKKRPQTLSPENVLQLQRSIGNKSVHRLIQRAGEPPPRRPKPSGTRSTEATPKDYYGIRGALTAFEPETIRPEDVAALSNEQLRSLDFTCEWLIQVAGRFASEQAADPSWSPPDGYPDIMYGNARVDMEKFRRDQIRVKNPYAALLATQNFFAEEGGDTTESKQHWDAAMPVVKELVWRMELGSAEPKVGSLLSFLSDSQITAHAYLPEGAWKDARKTPLEAGEGIDPAAVLKAVKAHKTVIPVRLAKAAFEAARGVSEEDRKSPDEATKDRVYNLIQAAMESELAAIDLATTQGLTYIHSQKVTGGLSGGGTDTHENLFWRFLWSETGGRDWKVLQRYRSWAGE